MSEWDKKFVGFYQKKSHLKNTAHFKWMLGYCIPFSVRFMFYGFCFLFSSVSYMLQINHIESVFMLLNFCHSSSGFFTLFLKNITLTVLFSFTYNSDLNSYATWVYSFGFVTCIVVFAIFIFFIWYDWAKHGKFHCELFSYAKCTTFCFFLLLFKCFNVNLCRGFQVFFFCLIKHKLSALAQLEIIQRNDEDKKITTL